MINYRFYDYTGEWGGEDLHSEQICIGPVFRARKFDCRVGVVYVMNKDITVICNFLLVNSVAYITKWSLIDSE